MNEDSGGLRRLWEELCSQAPRHLIWKQTTKKMKKHAFTRGI